MIVEKHAMGVAALAALKRDRNDLSALGVVAEAGRVRHADEFELHQRLIDFERLRHQLPQPLRIGAITDDEKFAIVEAVRADRVGGIQVRSGARGACVGVESGDRVRVKFG